MKIEERMKFLDLGRQPIANRFLREDEFDNEFFYDLYVEFDDETKLVSLGEFISSDMLFNENYSYYTGSSAPMISHFRMVADDIMKRNPISILEIGSNDGTFIKNFNRHMVIAVEPCMNFCQTTRDMGYTTYPYFWNRELADTILNERGNMDIVYAANCICHIPDLNLNSRISSSRLPAGRSQITTSEVFLPRSSRANGEIQLRNPCSGTAD